MLPSRAQAHLWPAAARYRSAVCVSHQGSGKTLGWILAVLDSLLDNQVYTGVRTDGLPGLQRDTFGGTTRSTQG